MAGPADHPFTPDLFTRADETDDGRFYSIARKVVHLDAPGLAALGDFFADALPRDAEILDLMASWRSHLPARLARRRVVGLGMNEEEMADNPDLDEWIVHDLNKTPELPFGDAAFDAALLTVSVQYLTQPILVFRSMARCLRPGSPLVVTMSDRCFPTKAVKIWHQCRDMRERMELGMAYFSFAGGFTDVQGVDVRPSAAPGEDPVRVVMGRRAGTMPTHRQSSASWRRR